MDKVFHQMQISHLLSQGNECNGLELLLQTVVGFEVVLQKFWAISLDEQRQYCSYLNVNRWPHFIGDMLPDVLEHSKKQPLCQPHVPRHVLQEGFPGNNRAMKQHWPPNISR